MCTYPRTHTFLRGCYRPGSVINSCSPWAKEVDLWREVCLLQSEWRGHCVNLDLPSSYTSGSLSVLFRWKAGNIIPLTRFNDNGVNFPKINLSNFSHWSCLNVFKRFINETHVKILHTHTHKIVFTIFKVVCYKLVCLSNFSKPFIFPPAEGIHKGLVNSVWRNVKNNTVEKPRRQHVKTIL